MVHLPPTKTNPKLNGPFYKSSKRTGYSRIGLESTTIQRQAGNRKEHSIKTIAFQTQQSIYIQISFALSDNILQGWSS